MTVVTRKRTGNFALVPNAVAEDRRLSFAARGLLCYLLAKPHDWIIRIRDIQNAGSIGRDKAYGLLRELRTAGYVTYEEVRDRATGRVTETNYTIYDLAIPESLPLPENPEAGEPVPEKPEAAAPLPENPVTGFAGSGKAARNNKTHSLPKPIDTKTHPLEGGVGFADLWEGWPVEHRPNNRLLAEKLFLNLPAPIDRISAAAHAEFYRKIQILRGKRPQLITYLKERSFRELVEAPDVDRDGEFIITPARPEWEPWIDAIRAQYGDVAAQSAIRLGRVVRKERWPAGRQQQMAMAIG